MSKLDRYISRQFLNILWFVLIAATAFFIIVDLVENLDRFIDRDVPSGIIVQYYIFFIPFILEFIMPIAVLIACLFSVAQLSRHNEISAMQTAGISLYRIALPLFAVGFVICIVMILFAEYVMPPASEAKFDIKRKYLDRISEKIFAQKSNINILNSEFERTFISHFEAPEKTAHNVMIQRYHPGELQTRLDANRMKWRDDHWIMEDGISRTFDGESEIVETFAELIIDNLPFNPSELGQVQKKPDEMNYAELKAFIRQVTRTGADPQKWLVDLHMKFSFPFANFVIVIFGFPLAAMQKKSGRALAFGTSLGICFLFFGLVKTLQTLGQNGILTPWLAAWGSDFVISGLGVFLLIKSKK